MADAELSTRDEIIKAIRQLQGQPVAELPTMPEDVAQRQRQLAVLSQLSGDKPLTTVGAQIFKDIEADQARREKFAEARNLANAQRQQGLLGILSSEEARREATAQRAETARQAHLDRMTLAGMRDQGKPMQIVEGANGERYWADPRTQQIVGPVMVGGQPLPAKTKNLPETALKQLNEAQSNAEQLNVLGTTFKPEYARSIPGAGGVEFAVGSAFGTASSNWWKNYNNWKNAVRHGQFGTALTRYEQEAFDQANVNYNTPASEVPKLLQQQADVFKRAYNRTLQQHRASNFDVGGFTPLPTGQAPAPGGRSDNALSAAEQRELADRRRRAVTGRTNPQGSTARDVPD